MDTYDTLRFHDDAAPRCAAGHRITELQTKDLACDLDDYVVFGGRLYRPGTERTESVHVDDAGRLVLTEVRHAERTSVSVELTAYGRCHECPPVLYLEDARSWHGDYVCERQPWCEWRFAFRDGVLERVDAVRVESRADVATALRREGLEVLDDEERLARLHRERTKDEWRGG